MQFSKGIQVLLALATTVAGNDFYARNLKTVQSIYNLTVFPSPLPFPLQNSTNLTPHRQRPHPHERLRRRASRPLLRQRLWTCHAPWVLSLPLSPGAPL